MREANKAGASGPGAVGGGGVTGLKSLGVRDLQYKTAFLACMVHDVDSRVRTVRCLFIPRILRNKSHRVAQTFVVKRKTAKTMLRRSLGLLLNQSSRSYAKWSTPITSTLVWWKVLHRRCMAMISSRKGCCSSSWVECTSKPRRECTFEETSTFASSEIHQPPSLNSSSELGDLAINLVLTCLSTCPDTSVPSSLVLSIPLAKHLQLLVLPQRS